MRDPRNDVDFQLEIADWLRANAVDPNDVPVDSMVTVGDGHLTVEVFERNENGHIRIESGAQRPTRRVVTVPLVVEPQAAVAEWVRLRCPTCGR